MLATQVHDLPFVTVLAEHLVAPDCRDRAIPLPVGLLRADTAQYCPCATVILSAENVAPLRLNQNACTTGIAQTGEVNG